MHDKWNARCAGPGLAGARQIRADLERKGVAREFSQPVADRLASIATDLSPAEYDAILSGVTAAYGVHRDDWSGPPPDARDLKEVQRLMQDFSGELGKLEEGLRTLSAYVFRLRSRTGKDRAPTLH
ncbi:MAG: hypothetical protein V3U03_15170 [Myxococcota bacterium]